MTSAQLLPLALLYVDNGRAVEGVTRLQKLTFLAQEQFDFENEYDFEAYDYGPYSKELYSALDTLERRGYLDRRVEHTKNGNERYVYSITREGRRIVSKTMVNDDSRRPLFEAAETVKKQYNEKPLRELLQYVYAKYPDYAENSKLDL